MPPKIHNLVKLAKLGELYSKMSEAQKDFLDILMPLNIEGRYPSYKANIAVSLGAERCSRIIEETEELLCWIKQMLDKPYSNMQTLFGRPFSRRL